MNVAPIEIIFYDEDDEVIAKHSRTRLPAYLLDMAIDLAPQLDALDNAEDKRPAAEKTAPLFDFIVELFGEKFSREELKKHSDLVDCLSVYRSVIARANSIMLQMARENPTPARSPRKK